MKQIYLIKTVCPATFNDDGFWCLYWYQFQKLRFCYLMFVFLYSTLNFRIHIAYIISVDYLYALFMICILLSTLQSYHLFFLCKFTLTVISFNKFLLISICQDKHFCYCMKTICQNKIGVNVLRFKRCRS